MCRKILKKVFEIRFDETVFGQAWSILKFDGDSKTIDKLELISLVNNLAKMLVTKRPSFHISDVSSAKLHRLANKDALKAQNPSYKLVTD